MGEEELSYEKNPSMKESEEIVNPSMLANRKIVNPSMLRGVLSPNPTSIRHVGKIKNPSMNKEYYTFSKSDFDERDKRLLNKFGKYFGGFIVAMVVFIFICVKVSDSNKDLFKGEDYFKFLGIEKTSTIKNNTKLGNYDLVEVDGVNIGTFNYNGEDYYRFQVVENGEKSYDMEITSYQGELVQENVDKPYVEVYRRTYDSTSGKYKGQEVGVFYYKLHVPSNKVKIFN